MKYYTRKSFNQIISKFISDDSKGYKARIKKGDFLLSAPHCVSQNRLGRLKYSEEGSAKVAICISEKTNSSLIIKTENLFDDANFDLVNPYRQKIFKIIKKHNIKYLIDFHGMSSKRECDINLGTNFGQNIKADEKLFNVFYNELINAGFSVSIDNPFAAPFPTISASVAKEFNIWALQVEINCSITDDLNSIVKLNKLINVFVDIINNVDKVKRRKYERVKN